MRESRYTTPAEQARIRRCLQSLAAESFAGADPPAAALIDRYTGLFRVVFNSMLADRRNGVPSGKIPARRAG